MFACSAFNVCVWGCAHQCQRTHLLQTVLVAAGGVSDSLIAAYRSILEDKAMDGSTAAMTLTLPAQSELVQVCGAVLM